MRRRYRRLARRFRSIAFIGTVLRSYREGRRRGQSRLAALRFGRAVAQWRHHDGAAHP
ncbi:MAG TPA: hypothetical protein VNC82_19835 [Candidatus Limnocylindria bacterium]|jgi:hypothetical protein|nr:hypothetical protein [Candidatus Limnocylindria bacterium]